jgi:hypothetical protein
MPCRLASYLDVHFIWRRSMLRLLIPATKLTVVALAGCNGSSTPTARVSGKVNLDKKPLAEGQIVFVTPGKAPEALPIKNGTYEGTVEVGDRRVEIMSYKDAPAVPMKGETFEDNKVNIIPDRYSSASQLRAKVTEEGPNEFNFDISLAP